MSSLALSCESLSRKYAIYARPVDRLKELVLRRPFHRDFWAVRDVDMRVAAGQTIGIIGPNGSGKSTLLQVFAGVLEPTLGTVWTRGRVAALLELGAGFNPEFTGRENVILNGAIMGIPPDEMRRRFDEIAAFAEIGDFIDQPVKTYSSGMYVRLAFATTINVDADLIIIDEALAVGDERFARRCYRRLEQFQRAGKTVIFVSHDTTTVKRICSEVYLLNRGQVIEQGDPANVVDHYHRLMLDQEDEYARWIRGQDDEQPQAPSALSVAIEAAPAPAANGAVSVDTEETESLRYGDHSRAEVVEFEVLDGAGAPSAAFESGSPCTFRVKIRFHQDVATPGVSYGIRTVDGVDVYALDNWSADVPIPAQRAGDLLTVDFTQALWLGVGSYFVQLGVSEADDGYVRVLDRRIDVLFFRVNSRRHIAGLANLNSKIEIPRPAAASR